MNLFIWNCRGVGNAFFYKTIQDMIRIHIVDLVALLETGVRDDRANEIVKKIGNGKLCESGSHRFCW